MIPHATEQLSLCDTTLHFCQSIFLFLAFPLFKLIFIGVQLIYTVVLVSAVQQSESIIHIHISTLFQILFPYISLHSIEQSSLCYTVRSYQLSILYIVVLYMSIPISQFIPPAFLLNLSQSFHLSAYVTHLFLHVVHFSHQSPYHKGKTGE